MGLRYVDQDIALHVDELRELMQSSGIDMTIFFGYCRMWIGKLLN
jgi:hypothetical protein